MHPIKVNKHEILNKKHCFIYSKSLCFFTIHYSLFTIHYFISAEGKVLLMSDSKDKRVYSLQGSV